MKKSVSVSSLTLNLWLHFVRPILRAAGMLDEVPARDDWHEYTAEVIDEATADEITHTMTTACFNAVSVGDCGPGSEAARMIYALNVSIKYRPQTAEAMAIIRDRLAAVVSLYRASESLRARRDRSRWDKAVTVDALEMVDNLADNITDGWTSPDALATHSTRRAACLNGAQDWKQYSYGGCALVYDGDIAAHYCTPSELRRTRNGEKDPNHCETWLDVQARALVQAFDRASAAIGAAYRDVISASAI